MKILLLKYIKIAFLEVLESTHKCLYHYNVVHLFLPILGSSLCHYYSLNWIYLFLISGLFIWYKNYQKWFLGCSLFIVWILYLNTVYPQIKILPKIDSVSVIVSQVPKVFKNSNGIQFTANWTDSNKKEEKILVRFYSKNSDKLNLELGQKLKLVGKFRVGKEAEIQGGFNEKKYLKTQGIFFVFETRTIEVKKPPNFFLNHVNKIRSYLINVYEKYTHPEATHFILAVILGIREGLDSDHESVFKNSGMYHLLAISGLHVGVISVILLMLLSFLRIPRILRFILVGLFLWFFVVLVGFPISVIRAVLIYTIILFYVLLERRKNGLYILTLSCFILILYQPYQVLSLGFQLTFTASFFLLYYGSFVLNLTRFWITTKPFLTWLVASVSLSWILSIVLSPFLLPLTNQMTPVSIIGNIVAAGIMPLLLTAVVLTPIFDLFSSTLAEYLGQSASFLFLFLYFILKWILKLPYAYFYQTAFDFLVNCWVLTFFILLPLFCLKKKWKLFLILALLSLSLIFSYQHFRSEVFYPIQIHFLNVGQGDAIFIRLPNNFNILIDGGNGKGWKGRKSMGERIVLPFLKYHKISQIDLMIVSHLDYDHYGGLIDVLKIIPVKSLFYPNRVVSNSASWLFFKKLQVNKKIPNISFNCGDTILQGEHFNLQVESPCKSLDYSSKNNISVVLRLEAYDQCFLLTGDIESQTEAYLTHSKIKPCDILKIPHHGSRSSSTKPFLDLIKPQIAILSVGKKNRYHHPHLDVIQRYQKRKIQIYSTAKTGLISFYLNSFGMNIEE